MFQKIFKFQYLVQFSQHMTSISLSLIQIFHYKRKISLIFLELWFFQVPKTSPDCVLLSNGNKPAMKTASSPAKHHEMMTENTPTSTTTTTLFSSSLESNKPLRFRDHHHHHPTTPSPTHSPARTPSPCHVTSGSGDVLLQWGQRKRSRVSRSSEIRVLSSTTSADESSSSMSALARQAKAQRRAAALASAADKSTMPPPPPPHVGPTSTSSFSSCRLRKEASSGLAPIRNLEDRSAAANGSPSRSPVVGNGSHAASRSIASKRSSPPLEKNERKMPACSARSAKDEKANGSSSDHHNRANHVDSTTLQSEQLAAANHSAAAEKLIHEVVEWPRIYLALSRKEKEDDFLAMKGTKLPQRPKKRAKNVDRSLQYCFPGMWLADLTRNRYEVREKKSVKKQKRRGLKGMENVESESE